MNLSKRLVDRILGVTSFGIAIAFSYAGLFLIYQQRENKFLPWFVIIILLGVILITIASTTYLGIMLTFYPPERVVTARKISELVSKYDKNRIAKPPGRIIILSGLDGCGKTSQLNWIKAVMEKSKSEYKYVNLRWSSIFSYFPLGLARLLGYAPREYNPRSETTVIVHKYEKFPLMRKIWPPLFVIDMWIAAIFKVIIPSKRGNLVICDRYVLDAIIDVAAMLNYPQLVDNNFATWLLMLLPPDAQNIIIDVEPETAFERKKDVANLSFLTTRRDLYQRLATKLDFPVVDGNKEISEVQKEIGELLNITPIKQ